MSDHEAVGAAITAYNDALTYHRAAIKRLTELGKAINRITGASLAVESWKIAAAEVDLRWAGGILSGDGNPIMLHMWPRFEEVADETKASAVSVAGRDVALEQLKDLGLDPAYWK